MKPTRPGASCNDCSRTPCIMPAPDTGAEQRLVNAPHGAEACP
jgi:hypothetical protein